MKNKFLLPILLIPFQLLAQTDPVKKVLSDIKNTINIPDNKTAEQTKTTFVPQTAFYRVIPSLHGFLDTASSGSIQQWINDTPDSILRLVENESETELDNFYSHNYREFKDKDGDGHSSFEAGGNDCNDLNPWMYPGNPEKCWGFLLIGRFTPLSAGEASYVGLPILIMHRSLNEDCNPCSVSGYSASPISHDGYYDGDKDGDGQPSCSCTNYSLTSSSTVGCPTSYAQVPNSFDKFGNISRYIIRGPDCDDQNPAIIRGAQQCLNDKSVKVCENGAWKIYNTHKCIVQPNGTGILLEW